MKILMPVQRTMRWRNGYTIKTKRFRLTKWGVNGELGYELYDHKNDKMN